VLELKKKQKVKDKILKEKEKESAIKEKEKARIRLDKEKKAAKPKRPLSANIIYFKSVYPELKAANSDNKVTEIMKTAAQNWKALSENEKKPFITEAAKEKKRYEADKKEAQKKAPPKKPLSQYIIFGNEIRPQIKKEKPDLKMTEIAVEIGKRWKKLSDAEKAKFKVKAEKLTEEYTKKYSAFTSNKKA